MDDGMQIVGRKKKEGIGRKIGAEVPTGRENATEGPVNEESIANGGEKHMNKKQILVAIGVILLTVAVASLLIYLMIGYLNVRNDIANGITTVSPNDKIMSISNSVIGEGWYKVNISVLNLTTGNIMDGTFNYNAVTHVFTNLPSFIMLRSTEINGSDNSTGT
jgi:hypothetical protein